MKSFMKALWTVVFLATLCSAEAQVLARRTIDVREEDGTPSGRVRILKFPNGTITINNDGSASIAFTGGGGGTNDFAMGGDLSGLASNAQIVAGAIVNADVSASAAIAKSKLALTGAILDADLAGSIAQAKVTSLTTDLALKAPLASPTFTGVPAGPTAAAATSTTQLATTAFATTADNLKANLASPTFTGVPAAPTATADTSTTQLATTAFVTTANNLKANLASPAFSGTPVLGPATATTAAADNNTTLVATTAYVQTELTAYDSDARILSNKTFADLTVSGAATVGTVEFEGATADAFETTIVVVDPTADRTITFPDASGTMLVSGGNIGAATATTAAANDNSTLVATTAHLQTELTAYASDTVSFTNKTFDAAATGNALRFLDDTQLIFPDIVDGTGCTEGSVASDIEYRRAKFSATADQAANWCEWRIMAPSQWDNAVNPTVTLRIKLNGADTGTHRYIVSTALAGNSATATPALGSPINLDFAGDASGADDDIETVASFVSLSGWGAVPGAGGIWVIRLARDGDAAQDASTVASTLMSLIIQWRRSI